jgi:hypothetical protein
MAPPLSVNIIYNKANTYGLNDDVQVIERILRKLQDSIGQPIGKAKTVDMREPLVHSDINIHLEIPVFSAVSWAHTNILLVNPEQWSYAYDAYVHAFDALIFRDPVSSEKFRADFVEKGIPTDNIHVVPWTSALQTKDIKGGSKDSTKDSTKDSGFVCFVAGSTSKYEYLKQILPYWTASDPSLTIYTTREDFAEGLKKSGLAENVVVKCQDLNNDSRYRLMASYHGHLVCSQGEAFGYAAANAEVSGAFTIMNFLPTFEHFYDNPTGIAWLSNSYEESTKVRYSTAKPTSMIRGELDAAFDTFRKSDFDAISKIRQESANGRFSKSCDAFLPMLSKIYSSIKDRRPTKGIYHCPPILNQDDCPPITIVTPTYNREKLIEIAFHNLLITDYPQDKIEWIVIEDNEKTPHMASEKIISFQIQVPKIKLKYIPIEGRMSIGEKRNHAIEHASNDIILFMDDDDHYPETSFRRRVAWLTKGTKRGETGKGTIACCTTLALYDLKFGTSAVNVPPFDIPFAQRISEATLTFRKSAWLERKFPNVSISEGEGWISGREDQVIEIPPQQIIVAFSHSNNQSSRRIPPSENKPGCFWGFPKEYLIFIHGLIGVQVEEDKKGSKR